MTIEEFGVTVADLEDDDIPFQDRVNREHG